MEHCSERSQVNESDSERPPLQCNQLEEPLQSLSMGDAKPNSAPASQHSSHLSSPAAGSRPPHLNSEIQARLMAFQQKRSQNINSPPLPPNSSPPQEASQQYKQYNGYRNSVPQAPEVMPTREPFKKTISENAVQNLPAHLLPSPISAEESASRLKEKMENKETPANKEAPGKFELNKKPSLSQRRGMKLNMKDLTNTSPESNTLKNKRQSPIVAGSGSSGAVGRTNAQPKAKFKLNLNELPDKKESAAPTDDTKKPQLQGLFANYSKYVDIKSGRLNFSGKASLHSKGVDFSSGSSFRISLEEFEYVEELGRGNYGSVSKVLHKPTGVLMAMKEVRLVLDETKFTQILMELEILHKCDSPYIVDFYGAFFVEGAVYMCMEYMDGGSLDKIFGNGHGMKDEASLAYVTECVIRGLMELKDKHNIIHRDVKPTNILINTNGKVKLCDFGVSGNLVASLAKTNIGCQSYMAPERIKTMNPDDATYSVQSDIWSLGLTILEVAAGHYPYPAETYSNIFSQLSAIVDGEPPKLDPAVYSNDAQAFVWSCLNKNPDLRPAYAALLDTPWLIKYRGVETNIAAMVQARVEELAKEDKSLSRSNSSKSAFSPPPISGSAPPDLPKEVDSVQSLLRSKVKPPALHRGGALNNRNFLNRA